MSSLRFNYYLFLSVFLFPTNLSGQSIEVDKNFSSLKLDRVVEIWEDTTKSFTIKDVLNRNLEFKRSTQNTLNFGYQNSYFWIRFSISNADTLPKELILEIENPHINKIQLFHVKNENIQSQPLTGDNLPFSTRQLDHPHFLFPINIPGGSQQTYYLWIDKHGEQVQCPLRLSSASAFNERNTQLMLFWGFLIGVVVLFAILSAMVFVIYSQKITFFYLGYAMSSALFTIAHTGVGFQYLWNQWTWWQSAARPTTALLMYTFFILFTISFLKAKQRSKILFTFLIILLVPLVFLLFVLWVQHPSIGIVKHYWYHPEFYSGEYLLIFMKSLRSLVSLILTSVLILGIFFFIKERKLESFLFMLSIGLLYFGAISTLLVFSGVLPGNLVTKNFPILSTSFESLLLGMMLASRWRTTRRENEKMHLELNQQREKSARNLIEGQLQERKRLSQQLHDSISSTLANLRLRMSMYSNALNSEQKELKSIESEIKRIGEDVRQISHDLSPVLLERYGLHSAIEELVELTASTHPNIKIDLNSNITDFTSVSEISQKTVYFTMQELLSNISKYADARNIAIEFSRRTDRLILIFKDDGKEYDPSKPTSGIGLSNLISRIVLLGGKIDILPHEEGMLHRFEIPI